MARVKASFPCRWVVGESLGSLLRVPLWNSVEENEGGMDVLADMKGLLLQRDGGTMARAT